MLCVILLSAIIMIATYGQISALSALCRYAECRCAIWGFGWETTLRV